MRKKILTIAFLLIFAASFLGWPMFAIAADEVSFTADTTILLGNGVSLTILNGGVCDAITVGTSALTVSLSTNSTLEIRSSDKYTLSNSLFTTNCTYSPDYSRLALTGQAVATDLVITPNIAETCPVSTWGSGSGGGGGSSSATTTTTTQPTTTTGQVTATVSTGGKTTLTTTEATSATVDLPANTVTSSTAVAITAENKTTVTTSRPLPSGQNLVGGYAYNFTATAGTTSVTTFSKNLTLTFTYIDSQIAGINEDTLKVYYWTGTQWSAIGGILDKVNNKITVTTNHFTYFAIMGEPGTTIPTTMAKPSDYGLKEGDLIRAVGDFDIFIISQYGYKRLFLNPVIFNMYGHLGGWSAVKSVAPSTRDAFVTSNYYRYVDSPKVYFVEVTGGDTGIFHWVNMTGENFLAQGGKADAIFTINKSELDWYPKGTDKTSL